MSSTQLRTRADGLTALSPLLLSLVLLFTRTVNVTDMVVQSLVEIGCG